MKGSPVISFDEESLLNALLYGLDEFHDKITEEILFRVIPKKVDDAGVPEEEHDSILTTHTHTHTHTHIFFIAKIKRKGKQRKKGKSFKAETIKRLSPRSTVLVMFTILF